MLSNLKYSLTLFPELCQLCACVCVCPAHTGFFSRNIIFKQPQNEQCSHHQPTSTYVTAEEGAEAGEAPTC